MPEHKLFTDLGLYLIREFVSDQDCRELIDTIDAAPIRRGVTIGGAGKSKLDETRRSVGDAKVPEAAAIQLKRSLISLGPDLERHFHTPLEWGGEGPDYLVYRTGDFFKPHIDNYESDPPPGSKIIRRRVAVILFLNGHSREPRENCFGGGILNFYGLLDGPHWKDCALGLESEPGLLVAFPSDLVHEVTPVLFGQRYSVLTGFHAPAAPAESNPS